MLHSLHVKLSQDPVIDDAQYEPVFGLLIGGMAERMIPYKVTASTFTMSEVR
jgi:hypothetical protein